MSGGANPHSSTNRLTPILIVATASRSATELANLRVERKATKSSPIRMPRMRIEKRISTSVNALALPEREMLDVLTMVSTS